jgi:hypothetical protein
LFSALGAIIASLLKSEVSPYAPVVAPASEWNLRFAGFSAQRDTSPTG